MCVCLRQPISVDYPATCPCGGVYRRPRNGGAFSHQTELGGLGDASSIDRSQINLEQGLVLIALLLVLFSQSNDLSKDLRIEAVTFGFLIDLPLAFV
jgi:hypothetical protein